MSGVWERLEAWLQINAPEVRHDLLPGAADADIAAVEQLVGTRVPDGFREVYAVHDGQIGIGPPLLIDWLLLPTKTIQREWQLMHDLLARGELDAQAVANGPVQAVWWNPKWLPVASNGTGDFQCIDLDPPSGGQFGQIVTFLHVDEHRTVAAQSLPMLFEICTTQLENGSYHLVDGEWQRTN
jgi:cell wall assembly regulator SMI1